MDESLRADGRRNRSAILGAALAMLDESGDITYTGIATRAGLTRATIYRHFPDRADLLAAVAQDLGGEVLGPLLAELDDLSLPDAWRHLATVAIAAGTRHSPLVQLLGSVEDAARIAIADEPITAFLERRRASGEITSELPDAWLARCVRAICLSAVTDTGPSTARADRLALTLTTLTSTDGATER